MTLPVSQAEECIKLSQIYVACLNKAKVTTQCDEALINYIDCINKSSNIIKKNNHT